MKAASETNKLYTTEEKIKEAARTLFTQKGYAATKTRDIAKEAGINSALLNYYFRSKEKLFAIIMRENLQQFAQGIAIVANETDTTLDEKIQRIVDHYTSMLLEKPEIPLFVINEIQSNPQELITIMGIEDLILKSHFFQQINKAAGLKKINPLHLLTNLIGLTVFPFLVRPMLQKIGKVNDKNYRDFLEERRRLIPLWIKEVVKE